MFFFVIFLLLSFRLEHLNEWKLFDLFHSQRQVTILVPSSVQGCTVGIACTIASIIVLFFLRLCPFSLDCQPKCWLQIRCKVFLYMIETAEKVPEPLFRVKRKIKMLGPSCSFSKNSTSLEQSEICLPKHFKKKSEIWVQKFTR